MDVIQPYQRQGIATMLLHHLYHFAQQKNVLAISLTTFRDIAWNAQFYHRFGFEYLPPAQQPPYLQNIVLDEYQQGFTAKQRCVMQLTLNSETATPSYSF